MGNTSMKWIEMSDGAILEKIGNYIKHERFQQYTTQAQLAESAGLNTFLTG